ncbi:bacteriophage abortive infection AbiH family protein [Priestia megaterium]
MSNLFIIGNGFDLAHGLPTSYKDFHKYLIRTYPNSQNINLSFNFKKTENDGYDKDEVVAFLIDVISAVEKDRENWCDIENSLGHLNFDTYFRDAHNSIVNEIGGEPAFIDSSFLSQYSDRSEDICWDFYSVTERIKALFSEWINTVDISDASPLNSFANLLDPYEDIFLTFNYTTVLEDIYGAIDVQHIHGVQNEEIVIGHGVEKEEFRSSYFPSDTLLMMHQSLQKETEEIVMNHLYPFLDNLVGHFEENSFENNVFIERIYTYGFSFAEVDLPYIKGICLSINTSNITWYLHTYHSNKERKKFEGIIKECGFKGRFDTFS